LHQIDIQLPSFNLIHRLTNPLNFEGLLPERLFKLTGSKSGDAIFGPVSGWKTRFFARRSL